MITQCTNCLQWLPVHSDCVDCNEPMCSVSCFIEHRNERCKYVAAPVGLTSAEDKLLAAIFGEAY